MTDSVATSGAQLPAELYVGLKDFYARHMKKRDEGLIDQWLSDFDENVTLSTNIFDTPTQEGRESIRANVNAMDNLFAQQEIHRRHCLGTFIAIFGGNDTIRTRCYTLLLTTKPYEGATVHSTSVACDLLLYRDKLWRVLSRHIERDDLAQNSRNHANYDMSNYSEEILMIQNSTFSRPVGRNNIYCSIEQFYAYQMQVLDYGDTARWVATFTKDGVFNHAGMQSLAGHDELLAAVGKSITRLASEGITRRHLVSTLTIDIDESDVVRTHCYVPVIDIENHTTSLMSTVLEDLLVFSSSGWLVQERTVRRDGLS
jgi:SnoaL-like domain